MEKSRPPERVWTEPIISGEPIDPFEPGHVVEGDGEINPNPGVPTVPALGVGDVALRDCQTFGLTTMVRWLKESAAEAARRGQPNLEADNARDAMLKDVGEMCNLIRALQVSELVPGGPPSRAIEKARQISHLLYEGVYDRWKAAVAARGFNLTEITDAADELKQYLAKIPGIGSRLYVARARRRMTLRGMSCRPSRCDPPNASCP